MAQGDAHSGKAEGSRQGADGSSALIEEAVLGASAKVKWRQAACELAGTVAAGIAGAASFAVAGKISVVSRLGLAGISGGALKLAVKGGMEHLLLDESERTVSRHDLAWGAVDGWAGVAGSLAEARVSAAFTRHLGEKALGKSLASELLESGGRKVLQSSAGYRVLHNGLRGIAGGAAGGAVWSAPHSVDRNWDLIRQDPLTGARVTAGEFVLDTAFGSILGGTIGSAGTAAWNWRELGGRAASRLRVRHGLTRVDVLSWNDMHSELAGSHGLPRLATKAGELRAQARASGRSSLLIFAGDAESGQVIAGFTNGGVLEHEAMARMGLDAITVGNHTADVGGSSKDIVNWMTGIARLDLPGVASNIDLPLSGLPPEILAKMRSLPAFREIFKPYRIVEVAGTGGSREKIGVIGLVTDEIMDNPHTGIPSFRFLYNDHIEAAQSSIAALHARGINKVLVVSHLGREADIELARKVEGISAIVGGHSHDLEPRPLWVKQGDKSRPRLWPFSPPESQSAYAGWDVPIIQAGSRAQWLAELNLALKPYGAADRYLTAGRLHRISELTRADEPLEAFINKQIQPAIALLERKYDLVATAPYRFEGVRQQETPLGNLIADALLDGVNRERATRGLPPLAMVLKHSGDIREGIHAGEKLSHYDFSNVFLNTGRPEIELIELATAKMTPGQIKAALEFGVADLRALELPATKTGRILATLKSWFAEPKPLEQDLSGNFLQVSGLRYRFDLSRPPGQRITGITFRQADGSFAPPLDGQVLDVLTLMHPIEKWGSKGAFGEYYRLNPRDMRRLLSAEAVPLSQVDLLIDYLKRKAGSGVFGPESVGYVEGRIIDETPRLFVPTLRPGLRSVSAYALIATEQSSRDGSRSQAQQR